MRFTHLWLNCLEYVLKAGKYNFNKSAKYTKIFTLIKIILLLLIGFVVSCSDGVFSKIEIIDFSPYSGQVTRSKTAWHTINSEPKFGPRDHASIIKVKGKIYLMGGFYRGPSLYQDYWVSDDLGISWKLIHGSPEPLKNDLIYPVLYQNLNIPAPYARFSYYDSLYWLIDKYVWHSYDGIVWHQHSKSYLDETKGSPDLFNIIHKDVQYSIDPSVNLIWDTRANFKISKKRQINANFLSANGAAVYSLGNHLYIAGGKNKKDFNNVVWRSLDGKNWKRVVDRDKKNIQLPWVNIIWPCVVEDNKGRVYLIGGYNIKNNKNSSDIWYTSDGINWVRYEDVNAKDAVSVLFPRHATACVFDEINSRIISIGGKGGINPDNDTSFVTKEIIGIPIP
jgi:hypothetical protein